MSEAGSIIEEKLGGLQCREAVILGSSLGTIVEAAEHKLVIPYRELPGFPRPSVSGHGGQLVIGRLGGRDVILLQGRVHYYESGDAAAMRPALAALAEVGVNTLVVTNAAGSVNEKTGPGRMMLITDHVNFSGTNPLIGEAGDEGFVPMTDAYDRECANLMRRAAAAENIPMAEGTYMWFSGPSFETPAEIKAARVLGADAVGMSTVPEVILARRLGLRVVGLSLITNLAAGIQGASPSHQETKAQGAKSAADMTKLITRFLELKADG